MSGFGEDGAVRARKPILPLHARKHGGDQNQRRRGSIPALRRQVAGNLPRVAPRFQQVETMCVGRVVIEA